MSSAGDFDDRVMIVQVNDVVVVGNEPVNFLHFVRHWSEIGQPVVFERFQRFVFRISFTIRY